MAKTKAAAKRKTTKKAAKKVAKKSTPAKKKSSSAKKSTAKRSSAKKTTAKKASASKKAAKKKATTRRTKKKATPDDEVTIDRRREDRRDEMEIVAEENQNSTAAATPKPERRKKVPRRRQIDPTTCERDYSNEEIEFMHALDEYKRANGRMFPTCSEILEVVRGLGYVKVEEKPESTDQPATEESTAATGEQPAEPAIATENTEPDIFGHVPGFSTPPENEVLGLPIADLSSDFTDVGGNHSF